MEYVYNIKGNKITRKIARFILSFQEAVRQIDVNRKHVFLYSVLYFSTNGNFFIYKNIG